jgi:nucleoside-diphosphate-sugar epimerase
MLRVGITGLTGMIGRNFLEYHRRPGARSGGLTLVALTRRAYAQPPDFLRGVACRRVDFTRPDSFAGALEDLDAVVHLAGLVRACRPGDFYRANRDGTAVLLEALARHGRGVRHLLHASSQTAVGPVPEGAQATDEDSPCRPVSHYGASKLAAERLVRTAPLPWTILRLPAVWGRHDPDGLNVLKAARGGLLPLLGGREPELSYLFAQDLAPLLPAMILNQGLCGGTFNLCYDRPVLLGEYYLAVRRLLGLPPRLRRLPLPRWTGYAAMGALAACRRLGIGDPAATADKVRELMAGRWVQSNQRLKAALGLGELRENGALADTVRWFREQGRL